MNGIVAGRIVHAAEQDLTIPSQPVLRSLGVEAGQQIDGFLWGQGFEVAGIFQFGASRRQQRDAGADLQPEQRLELQEARIELLRIFVRHGENEANLAVDTDLLDFLIDATDQLRGAVVLRDEEVDELYSGARFSIATQGLANQGDLTDFDTVVGGRQNDRAFSKTALIEPLHPLGGKHHVARAKRFGREPGRGVVIDNFLFRNRYHGKICFANGCAKNRHLANEGREDIEQSLIKMNTSGLRETPPDEAILTAGAKPQAGVNPPCIGAEFV